MLWVLAAVETARTRLSKRPYHYDMDPGRLRDCALQLYQWAQDAGVPTNGYTQNALLAVMANHGFVPEAERVFAQLRAQRAAATALPHAYELMLKLYDTTRSYAASQALLSQAQAARLPLSFEAWRAAVRTAALTDNLGAAVGCLRAMTQAGHRPTVEDVRALHLRLCEHEAWGLRRQLAELCLPPLRLPANPYSSWRQRSVRLAALLGNVYGTGRDAPQPSTKVDRPLRIEHF